MRSIIIYNTRMRVICFLRIKEILVDAIKKLKDLVLFYSHIRFMANEKLKTFYNYLERFILIYKNYVNHIFFRFW